MLLTTILLVFAITTATASYEIKATSIKMFLDRWIYEFIDKAILFVFAINIYNILVFYIIFFKDRKNLINLKNIQTNLSNVIQSSKIIYFSVDEECKVIDLKCSQESMLEIKNLIKINEIIDSREIYKYINICIDESREISETIMYENEDKKKIWFSFSCKLNNLNDNKRNKEKISCILVDITQQKNTMKILKDSESKFSHYNDMILESILEVDTNGNIIFLNKSAKSMIHNITNETSISIFDLFKKDDRFVLKDNFDKLIKDLKFNRSSTLNIQLQTEDLKKELIYLSIMMSARVNEFGTATFVLLLTDISKFKKEKDKLQDQLELEQIISSIRRDLSDTDKSNGYAIYDSMVKVCDYVDLDQVIIYSHDKNTNKIDIHKKYVKTANKLLKSAEDKNSFYNMIYKFSKKSTVMTISSEEEESLSQYGIKSLYSYKILEEEDVEFILVYCSYNKDILTETNIDAIESFTEILESFFTREYYKDKMIEKASTLDVLLEQSMISIFSTNKEGNIVYINDSAASFFGGNLKKEDLIDKNVNILFDKFLWMKKIFNKYLNEYKDVNRILNGKSSAVIDGIEKKFFIQVKSVILGEIESNLVTIIDYSQISS